MSPFRRKDPQKSSASFRIAGKDLGDPALQFRWLTASGSRVVLNRTFVSSEGELVVCFGGSQNLEATQERACGEVSVYLMYRGTSLIRNQTPS